MFCEAVCCGWAEVTAWFEASFSAIFPSEAPIYTKITPFESLSEKKKKNMCNATKATNPSIQKWAESLFSAKANHMIRSVEAQTTFSMERGLTFKTTFTALLTLYWQ